MTRGGQHACVLAGLLICLALTIVFVGTPPPAPQPIPAGGDDIPFPTRDVPTWDTKISRARSRVPASIVPEGVAVLLLVVIWTACQTLVSNRPGLDPVRRVLAALSTRRSFG